MCEIELMIFSIVNIVLASAFSAMLESGTRKELNLGIIWLCLSFKNMFEMDLSSIFVSVVHIFKCIKKKKAFNIEMN